MGQTASLHLHSIVCQRANYAFNEQNKIAAINRREDKSEVRKIFQSTMVVAGGAFAHTGKAIKGACRLFKYGFKDAARAFLRETWTAVKCVALTVYATVLLLLRCLGWVPAFLLSAQQKQKQIESCKARIESLEDKEKQATAKCNALQESLDEAKALLDSAQSHYSKSKGDIRSKKQELKSLPKAAKKERGAMKKELKELEAAVKELRKIRNAARASHFSAQKQFAIAENTRERIHAEKDGVLELLGSYQNPEDNKSQQSLIDDLKKKGDDLQAEIKSLKGQKAFLGRNQKEKNKQLEELEGQKRALAAELSKARAALGIGQDNNNTLTRQLKKKTDELSARTQEATSLQQQLLYAHNEMDSLAQKVADAKTGNNNLNRELEEKKGALSEATRVSQKLEKQVSSLRGSLEKESAQSVMLAELLMQAVGEKSCLQGEIAISERRCSESEAALKTAQIELLQAEEKIQGLAKGNKDLIATTSELTDALAHSEALVRAGHADNEGIRGQLTQKIEELFTLKSKIGSLHIDLSDARKVIETLMLESVDAEEKSKNLNEDLLKKHEQINQAFAGIKALQKRSEESEAEIGLLKGSQQAGSVRYAELEKLLKATKEELGKKNEQVEHLNGELSSLQVQYDESLLAKKNLEARAVQAADKINELETQNGTLVKQSSSLGEERDHLKKRLETNEKQLIDLEGQNKASAVELAKANEAIGRAKADIESGKKENNALQKTLTATIGELAQEQSDRKQIAVDLQKKTQDFEKLDYLLRQKDLQIDSNIKTEADAAARLSAAERKLQGLEKENADLHSKIKQLGENHGKGDVSRYSAVRGPFDQLHTQAKLNAKQISHQDIIAENEELRSIQLHLEDELKAAEIRENALRATLDALEAEKTSRNSNSNENEVENVVIGGESPNFSPSFSRSASTTPPNEFESTSSSVGELSFTKQHFDEVPQHERDKANFAFIDSNFEGRVVTIDEQGLLKAAEQGRSNPESLAVILNLLYAAQIDLRNSMVELLKRPAVLAHQEEAKPSEEICANLNVSNFFHIPSEKNDASINVVELEIQKHALTLLNRIEKLNTLSEMVKDNCMKNYPNHTVVIPYVNDQCNTINAEAKDIKERMSSVNEFAKNSVNKEARIQNKIKKLELDKDKIELKDLQKIYGNAAVARTLEFYGIHAAKSLLSKRQIDAIEVGIWANLTAEDLEAIYDASEKSGSLTTLLEGIEGISSWDKNFKKLKDAQVCQLLMHLHGKIGTAEQLFKEQYSASIDPFFDQLAGDIEFLKACRKVNEYSFKSVKEDTSQYGLTELKTRFGCDEFLARFLVYAAVTGRKYASGALFVKPESSLKGNVSCQILPHIKQAGFYGVNILPTASALQAGVEPFIHTEYRGTYCKDSGVRDTALWHPGEKEFLLHQDSMNGPFQAAKEALTSLLMQCTSDIQEKKIIHRIGGHSLGAADSQQEVVRQISLMVKEKKEKGNSLLNKTPIVMTIFNPPGVSAERNNKFIEHCLMLGDDLPDIQLNYIKVDGDSVQRGAKCLLGFGIEKTILNKKIKVNVVKISRHIDLSNLCAPLISHTEPVFSHHFTNIHCSSKKSNPNYWADLRTNNDVLIADFENCGGPKISLEDSKEIERFIASLNPGNLSSPQDGIGNGLRSLATGLIAGVSRVNGIGNRVKQEQALEAARKKRLKVDASQVNPAIETLCERK